MLLRALAIPAVLLSAMCAPLAASADTLYAAAPPAAAPGHPLRLGADHRAQQVGDIVIVSFAQLYSNNSADAKTTSKSLTLGAANILPHLPTSVGGSTGTASSNTRNDSITFVSTMAAVVTDVLPSGALAIAGDSRMSINGSPAVLHVKGLIRVEDIDANDSVPSNRIAALDGSFNGNFSDPGKGIIRKVLDVLF